MAACTDRPYVRVSMAVDGSSARALSVREQVRMAGTPADLAALARLCDRYLPDIYAFIARRVDDRAVAESLTAATLERAFGALVGGAIPSESIAGFLYRVAATAVVDHARRGRRIVPRGVRASDLDQGDDRAIAEAIADEAATRAFAASIDGDRLRRALVRLPDADRRLILLKYFDGLRPDEMCAALACSRATLTVHLELALRALRAVRDRQAIDAA